MFNKVYVGLPMEPSIGAALRVFANVGISAAEFRIKYFMGIGTMYVITDRAADAWAALFRAGVLSLEHAWDYYNSNPAELEERF